MIKEFSPHFLIVLATAGMAFAITNLNSSDWYYLLLAAMILLHIIFDYFLLKRQKTLIKLIKQCRELEDSNKLLQSELNTHKKDYFELFKEYLCNISHLLKYKDSERISVYNHNGNSFVMLGRYSENPQYSKRGRGIYPDSQGCLREAWEKGKSYVDNLPDPTVIPTDYYNELFKGYNILQETSERFAMKSRSYAAFRIHDQRKVDQIAVVVFESTKQIIPHKDSLKDLFDNHLEEFLSGFIERMRDKEPEPSKTFKEGF